MAAGNAVIGSLRVQLGLDTAQFQAGLKKSQAGLAGFAKTAAGIGAIVGTAMAAVAVGMVAATKAAIDNADEMGKTAQKVGFTVEALSRLNYAATLSDVSLGGLSTGLKKLSANMAATASKGTGPAANAFRALGVSVTDASGNLRDGGAVVNDLAGKFAGMKDGAGKTALAMAIFGKSGADLIPLLNSGADGLAEMAAEADALGITIDTKTAKSAEAFNDNLTRLKLIGGGLSNQLAAGMLPALESVSSALVGSAKNTQFMSTVSDVLAGTIRVLASAAAGAGGIFGYLGAVIGGVAGGIQAALKGQFGEAMKALDAGAAKATVIAKGTGDAIRAIWSPSNLPPPKNLDDRIAAPIAGAAEKVKKEKQDVDKAGEELLRALERLHDDLLTEEEQFSQGYSEGLDTLQKARAANLISEAAYLEDLQKLRNKYTPEVKGVSGFEMSGLTSQLEGLSDAPVLNGIERLQDELQQAADAADEVAFGIEDIFYGLYGNNWAQAAAGITRALSAVQKAFSAAGTSADKFAALSGVAQGVGSVIGGKTGSAISGAASGALAGFATPLGPVGAVIGGIGGLLGSLFGSSKQKKAQKAAEAKARADEAAAKAAQEAARLQQIANDKRSLEIALMEASGDAIGARNARLEDELAAADDSLDPLIQKLFDLQLAGENAAKALAVANERRSLEIEYMEATGDAAGALAAQRADDLAGLSESNRGLKAAIFAAEDYATALEAVSAAAEQARDLQVGALQEQADGLRDTISAYRQFSDSLGAFRDSLQAEAGINYGAAGSTFKSTASAARLGDAGALGSLQGVSEQFLAASKKSAKSQFEFNRDQALVLSAVTDAAGTADRTATVAENQLAGIESQIVQLGNLDLSVKGVQGSVEGLGISILAQIQDADIRIQASLDIARAAQASTISLGEQIEALRSESAAAMMAIAQNTSATARTLDRWDGDGQPEVRDVA